MKSHNQAADSVTEVEGGEVRPGEHDELHMKCIL